MVLPLPRRVSFDQVATSYDATRAWPPAAMEVALDTLEAVLPRRGLVLEPGAGTGRFAVPLQRRGVRLVGLDLSAPMLEQARVKGGDDLARGDAALLPFCDGAFEAALMVHLLHLVPDWREVLLEIARTVRGPVYSVVDQTGLRGPYEAYEAFLRARGEARPSPGVRERELPAILPPRERRNLVRLQEERSTAELLSELEARTFAFQWEVPEPAHRAAIAQLRATFAQPVLRGEFSLELLRWESADFRRTFSGGSPVATGAS